MPGRSVISTPLWPGVLSSVMPPSSGGMLPPLAKRGDIGALGRFGVELEAFQRPLAEIVETLRRGRRPGRRQRNRADKADSRQAPHHSDPSPVTKRIRSVMRLTELCVSRTTSPAA